MAWMHPDAEAYLRQRFTWPDGDRYLKPGPERWLSPEEMRLKYPELYERKYSGMSRTTRNSALGIIRSIEADRHPLDDPEVRRLIAEIKLDLLRLRYLYKANFNPNQPRVPAGNPDGGQWTSEGGGSSRDVGLGTRLADTARPNHQQIDRDATHESLQPSVILAAASGQDSYRIDLHEEEASGGHTIRSHVNRGREALIAQAQAAFDRDPRAQDARSGSFPSIAGATRLVNSTLAQNQAIVDQVAMGFEGGAVVFASFDSPTGVEVVIPNRRSQPFFRDTYGVGVVIYHDRYSPRRFRVLTAFPSNR